MRLGKKTLNLVAVNHKGGRRWGTIKRKKRFFRNAFPSKMHFFLFQLKIQKIYPNYLTYFRNILAINKNFAGTFMQTCYRFKYLFKYINVYDFIISVALTKYLLTGYYMSYYLARLFLNVYTHKHILKNIENV